MKAPITTHVLDTAQGRPAAGIPVLLELLSTHGTAPLGSGATDSDGRVNNLLPEGSKLQEGQYRLTFHVGPYLAKLQKAVPFYERIPIEFHVLDPGQHYHVPLLLSPFSYSTYRGS